MAIVRPFRAIRPDPALADKVACLPYDVMNRQEAKAMAEGNPYSFLRVVRSELELPETVGDYDDAVYEHGCANFRKMIADGVLNKDERPYFYVYRQVMDGRPQTGLVATYSVDEYVANRIRRHEFTRKDKEVDRTRHFDVCNAHTEPVFLTYRQRDDISRLIDDFIEYNDATYDFRTEDDILHQLWVIDDAETIVALENLFKDVDLLYIADGHHRTASAANVSLKRREENPDVPADAEQNFSMAVIFPDEDLYIMDYNRLVKDLNGLSQDEFLGRLGEIYSIEKVEDAFHPKRKGEICMYLGGEWYALTAPESIFEGLDPVNRLDVSILQNNVLSPILGVDDPRTCERIDFVGGIRGLGELKRRVDDDDWAVAFAMFPTTMEELLTVADAEMIMPPKSTWFEPKLRSGLFIHDLED
ncbi:MAG TPA: DUF1015 domain-containing protein [Clostridiaceae bacterium]|jgi:uncharacterized protein (DUF1015 family)|nr:DUF1015 domain-containing protein [Clostridiaceae bacterium]